MRFNDGAFDSIIAQSRKATEKQRLFLVHDVNNENSTGAIMLHDGKRKLGHVAVKDAVSGKPLAAMVHSLIDGTNDVVVCTLPYISKSAETEFRQRGSFRLRGRYLVHERLARKFADAEIAQESKVSTQVTRGGKISPRTFE